MMVLRLAVRGAAPVGSNTTVTLPLKRRRLLAARAVPSLRRAWRDSLSVRRTRPGLLTRTDLRASLNRPAIPAGNWTRRAALRRPLAPRLATIGSLPFLYLPTLSVNRSLGLRRLG